MQSYSDDPAWADIEPIPQDDTGHPLAAIAYSDEYSEAMSYLRAVMAKNEYSDRVLGLTEHIIGLNPAHYTVWYVSVPLSIHTLHPSRMKPRQRIEIALDNLTDFNVFLTTSQAIPCPDSLRSEETPP
jgi:protein farnesyltransferase/geranylgeranyltransferase type-1 subunit alpha